MTNSTLSEIVKSVMFGNLTNEQLDEVIQAVKFRRSELAKSTKRSITIGSAVSFSDRRGKKYLGHVTDIKVKNIIVKAGSTSYRVPASMLTVEE